MCGRRPRRYPGDVHRTQAGPVETWPWCSLMSFTWAGRVSCGEPCRSRRKRLQELPEGHRLASVSGTRRCMDAPTLYETWVGMGGEGIVLKNPALAVMLELAYKHPRTGKPT